MSRIINLEDLKDKVNNLLLNMSSGLLPKDLTEDEVEMLQKRADEQYGENTDWFIKLGYSEPKYQRSKFDKHISSPRPYTKEELCENLIKHIHHLIEYWDNEPVSSKDKLEGLGHSILSAIDGCTIAVPGSYKLVTDPHPSDKEYCISHNLNYVEPGIAINDEVYLHAQFFKFKK